MRAAPFLLAVLLATAGCDPAGLEDAFKPVPVTITGVVLDYEERPRGGSRLSFYKHDCAANGTAETPALPAEPAEVLTDAEGRFTAVVHVDSNRRGRANACLLVRAVLSSRIADPNYVLLPDSTDVLLQANRSTLELAITVPRGGTPGEPRWEAALSGGGATVTIVTTATNDAPVPIRFFLRSPGTVVHRAHTGHSITDYPVWDEGLVPGGIKHQRMEFHLEPGQSRTWTRTLTADDVLRWPYPPGTPPLPEGVYTFESVVVLIAPRSDVVRLPAGTVHVGDAALAGTGS
jgi:hypothetical protein